MEVPEYAELRQYMIALIVHNNDVTLRPLLQS